MNLRKPLFWLHLIIGCFAAAFIFLMSLTGGALTYERQMIKMAEISDYPSPAAQNTPLLEFDELLEKSKQYTDQNTPSYIVENIEGAPVIMKEGRKTLAYLNPYTGEKMATPGSGTKTFFKKLRAFHRWLTLDGKFSESGRLVNGIANLIFIALIISGIYLWLPKRMNLRSLKKGLQLARTYPNKSARNYNWHHVFGFYMAPILLVVVITAVFFSFKWPGKTLKTLVSTEMIQLTEPAELDLNQEALQIPIALQLTIINTQYPQWQTIKFGLNSSPKSTQHYQVNLGNGGEPLKRVTIALDTISGVIIQEQGFADLSTYRKMRSYIRFLHTGEIYGLWGQTIVGFASLLACLLVYTGVLLSWQRWRNSRRVKVNKVAYS